MSTDSKKPPLSLLDHLEPPGGLTNDWDTVFRCLADQAGVVGAFYSSPDVHLEPLEYLESWRSGLRFVRDNAENVLRHLHGRAPKTWNAGREIERAIFPVYGALASVVTFLTDPLFARSEPEKQAAPSRRRLGELRAVDLRSLLDELAAAVTAECGIALNLLGVGEQTNSVEPLVPLTSWAEIIAALNEPHGNKIVWKNDSSTRRKIRNLNETYDGPIVMPKKVGGQPQVAKDALMKWFAGLRDQFVNRTEEAEQDAESSEATTGENYHYGRSEVVTPEINGHLKPTRKKPK